MDKYFSLANIKDNISKCCMNVFTGILSANNGYVLKCVFKIISRIFIALGATKRVPGSNLRPDDLCASEILMH